MAYTLNTSHPLYANLVELIGVQDGALVSHKTPRTFTKHANASYGTGAYGEHFRTAGVGYGLGGAEVSPPIVIDTYASPNYTVILVMNGRVLNNGNNAVAFLNDNGGNYTFSSPAWHHSNVIAVANAYTTRVSGTTALGTGPFVAATTRADIANGVKLYLNDVLEATTGAENYNANTTIDYIGGYAGQAGYSADLVWALIFNKVLSVEELTTFRAGLAGDNVMPLIESVGGSNAAPAFIGTNIADIAGVSGTAITSIDVSSRFADSDALIFSPVGTWPTGVTVSAGGIISGTPTVDGTFSALKVRATDTASQFVESNTFALTISAASTGGLSLDTTHPLYANLVELINVQGGALVSHKTPRTFTKHANAIYGTGTYGEHIAIPYNGGDPNGVAFSPSIVLNTETVTVNYTVFIAINGRTTSAGYSGILVDNGGNYSIHSPGFISATNKPLVMAGYSRQMEGVGTIGSGAQSLSLVRAGEAVVDGMSLYLNGVFDSQGPSGYGNALSTWDYIGGYAGQDSPGVSIVQIALFNKALSAAELLDLHNSLGANGAFALMAASAPSPNGIGTGSPSSVSVSVPSSSAVGTGTPASATGTGALSSMSLSVPSASAAGTSGGSGTITTDILKRNNTLPYASTTGWTLLIFNLNGSLLTTINNLATDASGVITASSPLITAGTTYLYEPVHATYGRRLPSLVAT